VANTPARFRRRPLGIDRRIALVALGAAAVPRIGRAGTTLLRLSAVPFAEPIRQILAGERNILLAVGRSGRLWQMEPERTAARLVADGFDPESPVAVGHGRTAGRLVDASLGVVEQRRMQNSVGIKLAAGAGLLVLATGIIGVEATNQEAHGPVRLEAATDGQWRAVARGDMRVLPDARPLQVALNGEADGGHVVLLAGPDAERYPHGALGDAIEATRIVYVERHCLVSLRELSLPATEVFEDIAPRRVANAGGAALLTVISGTNGGQLALVGADPAKPQALAILARGEPIGARFRWLAPSTDGQHWLAVHTPHIGGPLFEYRRQDLRLVARRVAGGLANHRFGSRVLDMASWQGGRVLMPDQAGTRLRQLDGRRDWEVTAEASLPAAVAASVAMAGSERYAVLLQDGQVMFVEARG
jgi:hypothetical protein